VVPGQQSGERRAHDGPGAAADHGQAADGQHPGPSGTRRPSRPERRQDSEAADQRSLGIAQRLGAEMVGARRGRVVGQGLRRAAGGCGVLGAAQAEFAPREARRQQVINGVLQVLLATEDADGLPDRGDETVRLCLHRVGHRCLLLAVCQHRWTAPVSSANSGWRWV
jgi:hypothetical protein